MKSQLMTASARLLFISALLLLLLSPAFAQQLPPLQRATITSHDAGGLTWSDATWTMPSNTTGTYNYTCIVHTTGRMYTVFFYDNTAQSEVHHNFTSTQDGCGSNPPNVSLTAGHNYRMHIDIPLGSDPHLDDVVLAETRIFFDCQQQ